jgi:hypothetical protein
MNRRTFVKACIVGAAGPVALLPALEGGNSVPAAPTLTYRGIPLIVDREVSPDTMSFYTHYPVQYEFISRATAEERFPNRWT